MSETTTTEAPPETQPAGEPQDAQPDLGDAGKKAIEAERRRRAAAEKEAKALKAQLDQIAAAQMSDVEKAQKAAQDAASEAQQARAEALRYRMAARFGISDEDAETFLTGADEESITRQAERLVEIRATPTTPKPDPSQGAKGGAAPATAHEAFASFINPGR